MQHSSTPVLLRPTTSCPPSFTTYTRSVEATPSNSAPKRLFVHPIHQLKRVPLRGRRYGGRLAGMGIASDMSDSCSL